MPTLPLYSLFLLSGCPAEPGEYPWASSPEGLQILPKGRTNSTSLAGQLQPTYDIVPVHKQLGLQKLQHMAGSLRHALKLNWQLDDHKQILI